MNGHAPIDMARARARIDELKDLAGALMPILHALQDEFGYIDRSLIPEVADAVNLSRAEVVGVINFYHDFRQEPPGRHILQVCRAEACQSVGCEALLSGLESRFGIRTGETTADGMVTLKAVYCLGNCALGPSVMLDGNPIGRATVDGVERRLKDASR